jgi:hypothetical protein
MVEKNELTQEKTCSRLETNGNLETNLVSNPLPVAVIDQKTLWLGMNDIQMFESSLR